MFLFVSAISSGAVELSDAVGVVECDMFEWFGVSDDERNLCCGAVVEGVFVQLWQGEVKVKALTALARHRKVK
jgi:hypothetical protein